MSNVTPERSIRGRVAIVGVGETAYYKHGQAPDPEVKLALQAILAACADAGLDPRSIDGFASYSNDRNDPSRLAAALGIPELRFSNMQWGGGGGGGSAAVGNAAAAIAAGYADCVVVFRALAQGQFQRFGAAPPAATTRRPMPRRASRRWRRTCTRWPASGPRTSRWSRATRTSPAVSS